MSVWDKLRDSAGGGNFVKLEPGKPATVHILDDEPFPLFLHWSNGKSDSCKGIACPHCTSGNKKIPRFGINVYDFKDSTIKLLEAGRAVFIPLGAIREAYDGKLDTIDIKITRTGAGMETEYAVVPVPTKFASSLINGMKKTDLVAFYTKGAVETDETPF